MDTDNILADPTRGEIGIAAEKITTAAGSELRMKPAGRWAVQIKYDPDKGCREEDFLAPADEYAKRFNIYESYKIRDEQGKETDKACTPELDAVMLEPVKESKRWRPQRITSAKAMKQFFESDPGRLKQMIEQTGLSFDSDLDRTGSLSATNLIDREFVPIMFGPFYKQLYIYDYLLMHGRAFQLKNHNALAAAATKIMTRFTLGRGVSFHIKHNQAKEVWDEFWKRNNMRKKIRLIAADLCWQGEMLLRYYEPMDGMMTLRVLDASTCWEIITDPEDIEVVYYYHFQWPTPYQIWVSGQIPIMRYVVQQVPPTNIQHFKINVSAMEKRGRTDFFPGMSWLKRYDDYYNGQTVKSVLEANLVWKVKVKGDQADVDAFMQNPQFTELPPPGAVWVENEAVELTATSAVLTSSRGSMGIGQQLAAAFALSLNLPNEYFNVEGGAGGAKATALVRTDPAVKAVEDRQQIVKEEVEEMYDRVISSAILAGRISRDAGKHDPEMVKGDPSMIPAGDEPDDDDQLDPRAQRRMNGSRAGARTAIRG